MKPYLGRVVINPPQNAIGTTERVVLKCISNLDHRVAGCFLILPQMCEGNCRLKEAQPEEIRKLDCENSEGKMSIISSRNKVDQLIMPRE